MTRIGGRRWLGILRSTWNEIGADHVSIVASGVAFRVALALFPAIALLVWVGGRTVGPDEAQSLIGRLSDLMPDASRSIVKTAVDTSLQNNPAAGGAEALWLGRFAPVIGVAVTLWTANSGMKALFVALNVVYDEEESRGFLRRNLITLVFTSGTLLLLVLATGVLLASPVVLFRLGLGDLAAAAVHWLRWPALFVGFALALSLLYRYAPNRARRRAHWPPVTLGSAIAAGLLVLGTALFSWFTTRFLGLSATYGSLSTVMAFLIWLWAGFLVVLVCAEFDSVVEQQTRDASMMASKTIVENASQARNLTTLATAVKEAGLVDTLSGAGPFTVFAPTDAAFDKLPKATVEELMKPDMKPELKKLLTYHVVPGRIDAAEIEKGIEAGGGSYDMTTVEGETLTAKMQGDKVAIIDTKGSRALVETPDVYQSNGVVHVIDSVLMPK